MKPSDLKQKPGCGGGCLVLILAALAIIFIFNLTDFEVMRHFGSEQYFRNLITFHVDEEHITKAECKVYGLVPLTPQEVASDQIDTLIPDTVVLEIGIESQEYMDWLAISYYSGKEKRFGYIAHDEKTVEDFNHSLQDAEEALKDILTGQLKQADLILHTTNKMQMQMVANSSEFKVINETATSIDYARKSNLQLIESLTDDVMTQAPYVLFQNGTYPILEKQLRGVDLFSF